VLKDDIPYDDAFTGFVYVFAWPSKPGFLKIGYTARSIQDRFDYWKEHHPGLKFVCSIFVSYPKRIEALIHLELRYTRHEIIICHYCHNLHNEWFQVSEDVARETLTAWKQITTREALYTEFGQLGGWWAAELRNSSNEHNSAYLTSLLDESDRLAELERQAELAQQLEQNRVAEQRVMEGEMRAAAAETHTLDIEREASVLEKGVQAAAAEMKQRAQSAGPHATQAVQQAACDSACVSSANMPSCQEKASRRSSDVQECPEQSTGILADQFEALELGVPSQSLNSKVEEVKSPKMIKQFMSAVKNASTNKLVKLRRSKRIESVGQEADRGVADPLQSFKGSATQLSSEDAVLAEPNISHLPTPLVSTVHRKAVPLAGMSSMLARKAHAEKPPGYPTAPEVASLLTSDHESDAVLQAFFEFFGMLDLAQDATLHDSTAADAAIATTSTPSAAPGVPAVPIAVPRSAVVF
jgi:hypothetical protein